MTGLAGHSTLLSRNMEGSGEGRARSQIRETRSVAYATCSKQSSCLNLKEKEGKEKGKGVSQSDLYSRTTKDNHSGLQPAEGEAAVT